MNFTELPNNFIRVPLVHELLHFLLASLEALGQVLEIEAALSTTRFQVLVSFILEKETAGAGFRLPIGFLLLLLTVSSQSLQVCLAANQY